jgi:hypothetical protein
MRLRTEIITVERFYWGEKTINAELELEQRCYLKGMRRGTFWAKPPALCRNH